MPDSSLPFASFRQRAFATAINLIILAGISVVAETLAGNAGTQNPAARAIIATKTLFGIWTLFWLACGHMRSSPGLALMKLRVVDEANLSQRISLPIALFRPLPYGLFLLVLIFPVHLLPRSIAPAQFLAVLVASLFLAANCTPLWSGPDRRSLLDKWLRTRVVKR
jgi:hypothetical protein